jgi:hypothetical protein
MASGGPVYTKKYVEVEVDFRSDGLMLPRALIWDDGRRYGIDRVRAVQSAPALKAGGSGDRYTVMICGQERYLFFEHSCDLDDPCLGRWFVETT